MIIPENIAERYVSSVEREAERARLYTALITAQQAHRLAQQHLEDAAYTLQIAQNTLDEFEEDKE